MALLTQDAPAGQVTPGLVRMADRLTPDQRRTNRLVFGALGAALLWDRPCRDFADYLAALAAQSPVELRARVPADVDAHLPDPDLQARARALRDDPLQLREVLVSHLRALWEMAFEAEWRRTSTRVQQLVQLLNERAWPPASAHDVVRIFARREVPDAISLQLAGVRQVVVAPTPHIRLHAARLGDPTTLWLFVLADFAALPLRAEPFQRGEALGPLRALGDETRLQILELLAANEPLRAQKIIAQLDVGQSTVSRHLKQLATAGFVTEERTGDANKVYRLHTHRLPQLCFLLRQLLSATNARAILSDARRDLPRALHRFVDRDGLVTQWPRGEADRAAVLDYLVDKFQRDQLYTEAEVNDLLDRWHTFRDPAHLRRELYEYGYMGRSSSGGRYWRER
jgi:hypothetical protein